MAYPKKKTPFNPQFRKTFVKQLVPRHLGWVTKNGGRVKSWKRRYLVLAQNYAVNYWKDERCLGAPIGSIQLKWACLRLLFVLSFLQSFLLFRPSSFFHLVSFLWSFWFFAVASLFLLSQSVMAICHCGSCHGRPQLQFCPLTLHCFSRGWIEPTKVRDRHCRRWRLQVGAWGA